MKLTRLSHAPLNPHGIFLGPLVHLFLHLGLFLRVHGPEAALPGRPVPIRGLRLLDLRKALVERQIVPHWILDFQKTKVEIIFLKHCRYVNLGTHSKSIFVNCHCQFESVCEHWANVGKSELIWNPWRDGLFNALKVWKWGFVKSKKFLNQIKIWTLTSPIPALFFLLHVCNYCKWALQIFKFKLNIGIIWL